MKTFSKIKLKPSSIILSMTVLILLIGSDGSSADDPSPSVIWSELLQRTPFPFRMALPPPKATPIDGTYTKFETKENPPVPCRRCPDYAPEGGIWKLNFNKGVFRIFHVATGWKDLGSYMVTGDRLTLANDPVCHEMFGEYKWKMEKGMLMLTVIEDKCAISLRAMNLTKLPWLSCQPPNIEAAVTDHWSKPLGCD
ncbi:MAG: hypothetical protein FJ115_12740 [Deltaproteobacteria bacterium]|nr:hypothetical protein [Deltaproteobacteria bacterium]MBM4324420.1 hypothetical protein [Deltaproteobacteria bacterium]